MSLKMATNNHKTIDDNTMALIAKRVAEYKKSQENSTQSSEDINNHIEALSEVFDLDKNDVEYIAKDILIKKKQQATFKDKLYDAVIKYSKEVIISIVIVVVVAFLLLGRSGLQLANITAETPTNDTASIYRVKAQLANLLATISPIKIMLIEYYMNEGQYPKTLNDIGLERSEMKAAKGINDLILTEDGSILVKLDKSLGESHIMMLSPKFVMGGMKVEWQCKVSLATYIPGCTRVNADKYLAKF